MTDLNAVIRSRTFLGILIATFLMVQLSSSALAINEQKLATFYDTNFNQDANGNTITAGVESDHLFYSDHFSRPNSDLLEVDEDGWYIIHYGITFRSTSADGRHIMQNQMYINNDNYWPSKSSCYVRKSGSEGNECQNSMTTMEYLYAGDNLRLKAWKDTGASGNTYIEEDTWIYARKLDNPATEDMETDTPTANDQVTLGLDHPNEGRKYGMSKNDPEFERNSNYIEVQEDGIYKIYNSMDSYDDGTCGDRQTVENSITINGNDPNNRGNGYAYPRDDMDGYRDSGSGVTMLDLSSGDRIRMEAEVIQSKCGGGHARIDSYRNGIVVEKINQSLGLLSAHEKGGNGGQTIGSSDEVVEFDTLELETSEIDLTNNRRVEFNEAGVYEVSYVFNWKDNGGGRQNPDAWLEKNGNKLNPSQGTGYSRGSNNQHNTVSGTVPVRVNEGDYLELLANDPQNTVDVEEGTGIHVTRVREPNIFTKVKDSNSNEQTGVETDIVENGDSCLDGLQDDSENFYQTNNNGIFWCVIDEETDYDVTTSGFNLYNIGINLPENSNKAIFNYNQYDPGEFDNYENLTLSGINQIADELDDMNITVYKAGTDKEVFTTIYDNNDGLKITLNKKKKYRLRIESSYYDSAIVLRDVRVPDVVEVGSNQNFIPESTMDNSIKFSAGHTLPAQSLITRPFSDFDVVNVSIEKNFNDSYRLVSDVLVRKYNVNFEGQWQDWSNRKTVTVQDIYNRDWSDSTGEMNDAWGIIEFNPEGFQNNDCSDVRLTDTSNNVQDFTVNTCQDDYVQLEFNAPIDALEAKDFYVYYGNSEETDAQTSVERLSETEDFQMDNGITDTEGGFWFQSAGQKNFNMSIPQNVEFLNRDINIEGNNQDPQDNQLSSSIDDDYQEYSGIEFTPKRPTVIEGMDLEMASTTVDSEIAIRNMSSGSIIHTRSIPDDGPGSYYINFTDESLSEGNGDNIIYRPSDTFRVIVRNGQARRDTSTVTSSPMFEFPDFTVDNQVHSCSSDGSSCSTGDYPTLVSSIETISLLPDLTITYDNEDTVLYDEAQHLNTGTIDLSSVLQSEEWREGDPLDDPRVHEFTVDSGDEGNITLESYSSFEFEHPVESVTKNAAACSVNPQSSTYFYIDKTDCPYLDRINVTQGQWFRLDYRFRVPGPSDFENTGDINSYNVSDTMVRYNTLAETEEFTSG